MSRWKKWIPPLFDDDGWAYERQEARTVYNTIYLRGTQYGWRCQYPDNLKLGKNVDIGCFTYLNSRYGIEIGDNVQIGAHCAIYSDNTENGTKGKVVIGENSMIGSYTLILPNVVILPNSKIPARSILKV